jgi:hypothetical protein
MGRKLSLAAVCVGLLCTTLCACVYFSEHRPGDEPGQMFWEMAGAGVMLLSIGVRGCLGQFDA